MAVFSTEAAVVKGENNVAAAPRFSLRTMIVKPMGVPIFQEKTG
jgi:hypothetical protein